MNIIKEVTRDASEQVVFAVVRNGENETLFWRNNGSIERLGKEVSAKTFNQIRAILFQKSRIQSADNAELPEKTRDLIWLRRQRPVGRKFLSAIDAARFDTLEKCGVIYLPGGWIRIRRWIKEGGVINHSPQHVPDLDASIRMQTHILERYRGQNSNPAGEFGELEKFDDIIREANRMLTRWKNAAKKERMEIADRLTKVVLRLEKCRNDFKTAIHGQLSEVISLADSLGRPNPGALAARTVAALNDLAGRFQEMRIIMPIIALRHELLIFEKKWFEGQAKQISITVRNLLRQIYHQPGRSGELDNRFGRILHFTGFLWPSPYYERAKSANDYLLAGKKAARQNQPDGAMRYLIIAHHLLNGGYPPKKPL